MSSDDYGTVNLKRGDRTREIEILRQHYRRHHESLQGMIEDAPTEHLAAEYERLMRDIEGSLTKLDEIEGRAVSPAPAARTTAAPATGRGVTAPLVPPPSEPYFDEDTQHDYVPPERAASKPWLLPLIVTIAVIALAGIGWLAWKGSGDEETPVIEEATTVAPETQAPEPAPVAATGLAVTPPTHDFGVIRKGTRATRQYEITNNTDEPITVQVARSACRCLYYEHAPVIPPKAKESLTVTVDGAKAKSGELEESIRISAKADPTVAATFDVTATVR